MDLFVWTKPHAVELFSQKLGAEKNFESTKESLVVCSRRPTSTLNIVDMLQYTTKQRMAQQEWKMR